MADSTITCPKCHHAFALTEAMAAPIEATLRAKYEQEAKRKAEELAGKERTLLQQQTQLDNAKATLEEQISARLAAERQKLSETAKAKAREELAAELKAAQDDAEEKTRKLNEARARELDLQKREKALVDEKANVEATLRQQLEAERGKIAEQARKAATSEIDQQLRILRADLDSKAAALKEAQAAELALREERRKLQDEKDAMKLQVARELDEGREKIKSEALRLADEQARLRMAEKEKTIADLQSQLQNALRKAEQGSQQSQGEVLELELETMLRKQFPFDLVEPVPKGVHGGDVIQRVRNDLGQICGTILWESKRTKAWSDGWLSKLRDDGRSAKADAVGLMTVTMPSDICTFGQRDGVWITSVDCVMGVATALRAALMQISDARRAMQGQQGKMEQVYAYLTGSDFRQQLLTVVDAFSTMREDLEKEKKVIMSSWAKRERQIQRSTESAMTIHGAIQAIAGKDAPSLPGLALEALDDKATDPKVPSDGIAR